MTDEALAIERFRRHPREWIREVLGGPEPWHRQNEIVDSVRDNRETNVASGHAIGKDWICARVALWWLYSGEDSIVVTTATKRDQVEKILWGEIRSAHHGSRFPLGGVLQPAAPEIRIGPKWYAFGMTAKEENAFAGFHSRRVLVILDEAAGIAPFIFDAAEGCAAGEHDRILRIGNPKCGPTHPFAKACALPDEPGKRKTIVISSTETPNYVADRQVIHGLASRAFVEGIARKYGRGSVTYGAMVEGKFPGAAADGLISIAHLASARERLLAGVKPVDQDVIRLGADVARFGDDLTRIYARRGPFAWEVEESPLAKADGPTVARAIAKAALRLKAMSAAIDGGGLGAGPIDSLRDLIRRGEAPEWLRIFEVQFGSQASDPEQWYDRRTELWWRMRDWLKDQAAIDADATLEEELLTPRYEFQKTRVKLEAKDETKKRLEGRSPDAGDALALAVSGHLRDDGASPFAPAAVAPEEPRERTRAFQDLRSTRRPSAFS